MGEAWDRVDKKEKALQAELRRFKRAVLKELLDQLTPSERARFNLIYGTQNASNVSMIDIRNAIDICERTIVEHRTRALDVIAEKLAE
jgi:hypothetical protein